MSNIARSIRLEADQERIRLWRLERQKIAEVERQKRLAEREQQKLEEAESKAAEVANSAVQLSPTQTEQSDSTAHVIKRVRWRRASLGLQALAFVALPMAILVYYYFWVATPLFQARTTLAFEKFASNEVTSQTRVIGNGPRADLQLAFSADAFIKSQNMLDLLESKWGLKEELSGNEIDPIKRLRGGEWFLPDETAQFRKFVDSAVDVQTGFLSIEVNGMTPQRAQDISDYIVEALRLRVLSDNDARASATTKSAEDALTAAENAIRGARSTLVALQIEHAMMNPTEELQRITDAIAIKESEIEGLNLKIARSEISGRGSSINTQQDMQLRDLLLTEVEAIRLDLLSGNPSLTEIAAMFESAELEIVLAERRLDAAYQALADVSAANRLPDNQVSIVVPTQTASAPQYPRKLSGLLTAFVILCAVFFFARITVLRPWPSTA